MLKQSDADHFISLQKKKTDETAYLLPMGGVKLEIPLESLDGRESFLLDVRKGRLNISKVTLQNRYAKTEILVRVDFDGPPHKNPELLGGDIVPTPHLHLYKEGFGDKFAVAAPPELLGGNDLRQTLEKFLKFCNVVDPPNFAEGLFDA